MTTWTEMREELTITELEELLVEREKTIIKDMVRIREEQGLSQAQLGRLCKVKQPVDKHRAQQYEEYVYDVVVEKN